MAPIILGRMIAALDAYGFLFSVPVFRRWRIYSGLLVGGESLRATFSRENREEEPVTPPFICPAMPKKRNRGRANQHQNH